MAQGRKTAMKHMVHVVVTTWAPYIFLSRRVEAWTWNATGAPLEYCRAGEKTCERLPLPSTFDGAVYLDDGSLTTLHDDSNAWRARFREMAKTVPELVIMRDRRDDATSSSSSSSSINKGSSSSSMGVKFRNFWPSTLEIRWDDGSAEGVYSGTVASMGRTATMTYEGHRFKFVDAATRDVVARFEMVRGAHLYVVEPRADDVKMRASEAYAATRREVAFTRSYLERTGAPWLAYYPRDAPKLTFWPADFVGQTHVVYTAHGPADSILDGGGGFATRLTVLSKPPEGPRVFLARDVVSAAEATRLVESEKNTDDDDAGRSPVNKSHRDKRPRQTTEATPRDPHRLGESVVKQSRVGQNGGFESKTRTSANGWLRRGVVEADPILRPLYRRFADVLGLDEAFLDASRGAEDLQIVRYDAGQEYAPHHDFGDDGSPNQRFLTLLLYLRVPERGGATSFPKALDGRGLRLKPNEGDAVLFYNALPDGNADDLALHAGTPVVGAGQKWVANLWVWDPSR